MMWKLNSLDRDTKKKYVEFFLAKIEEATLDVKVPNHIKSYLTQNKIKEILLLAPSCFDNDTPQIINGLFGSRKTYDDWCEATRKRKRSLEQKQLVNEYKSLNKIFDYDKFIVKDKETSYQVAELIGRNSCVYCNRQYVFVVNKKKKVVRPEFDHFMPKSKYPFFALSLYNLIPSCHICNSNCKGTKELPTNMNPYIHKGNFTFSYTINNMGVPSSVDLKYDVNLDDSIEKEKNAKDIISKINEIYNCHTNLELRDLHTFATKYSDTYLQDVLAATCKDLNISKAEAYRILFGTELFDSATKDRPLSKFKRDILIDLKVIETGDVRPRQRK